MTIETMNPTKVYEINKDPGLGKVSLFLGSYDELLEITHPAAARVLPVPIIRPVPENNVSH